MNRKLIRTTLAEVKGKVRETPPPRERTNGSFQRSNSGGEGGREAPQRAPQQSAIQVRNVFLRQWKQTRRFSITRNRSMRTPSWSLCCSMVRKLKAPWSGMIAARSKLIAKSAPNLLVLKRNIKYMYKADERVEQPAE